MSRKQRIGRAFGGAVATYPARASVQRQAAERLAGAIAALPLPPNARVLEIGCGTGFLTAALVDRLPGADILVSDLSPEMTAACRAAHPGPAYLAMDGEKPSLAEGGFDLVCSSLAFQWFEDLEAALPRLCRLLKPGGRLAFSTLLSDSLQEWRAAHEALGLAAGAPAFAAPERLRAFAFEGAAMDLSEERIETRHESGADFIRTLKEVGANVPAPGRKPLPIGKLRRVLARFEASGATATYHLGYALLRRPAPPRGVFVTGTDTGVGKTVVSAILARAWGADYWKPVQTGVADEAADAETVTRLAGAPVHPSAYVFQAPLSPHAAAALEGERVDLDRLSLPASGRPIVVEGAGGVFVPLNDQALMIDLMARLGLPVVVVARSTLGTINHTLLTLAALKARGLAVAGVVMAGPPSASNREAIEGYGHVRVLAEIPYTDELSPAWVASVSRGLPPLVSEVA